MQGRIISSEESISKRIFLIFNGMGGKLFGFSLSKYEINVDAFAVVRSSFI